MLKYHVQTALEAVAEARIKWIAANHKFRSDMDTVLERLIYEAAANHMSAEQVAGSLQLPVKSIRDLMRKYGMDPRRGKNLLAKHAALALQENAALLGIEPHEMDLMSPLAYLPMGSELRKFLETNEPEDSYEKTRARINASIRIGIDAEQDWPGPSIKPGDLTDEQIEWLASWLAGDGIK